MQIQGGQLGQLLLNLLKHLRVEYVSTCRAPILLPTHPIVDLPSLVQIAPLAIDRESPASFACFVQVPSEHLCERNFAGSLGTLTNMPVSAIRAEMRRETL